MLLYHYSKEKFSALQTRRKSNLPPPEGVKVSDSYLDHISLFIDPIPSALLPTIFDQGRHPVWYTGNNLYEYTVDSNHFPPNTRYRLVETPLEAQLFSQFARENNWVGDDPKLLARWKSLLETKQKEWREIGVGSQQLEEVSRQFVGKIWEFYRAQKQRAGDFKDGYMKYAAGVPHVMVYPPTGSLPIAMTERVIVGQNLRYSVR